MKKLVKGWLILVLFCITFNVKAEPGDATLKNIKVNGENVVCTVKESSIDEYNCLYKIENNNVNSVKITYEKNDESANVTPESIDETVKEGENIFTATVTNGETKKTYNFNITKTSKSTDGSLKKLTINGETVNLKENILKYEATVSHASTKLDIEAIPNNAKATIEGATKNKISYDFLEDSKEVKIKIKSESGDYTTYTIKVTKREEKDASLKSITIKGASIDFVSTVYEYEVTVLKSVEALEVEAVAVDSDAKVTITNPKKLEFGNNTITIKVENDGNTKTYVVKVNRLEREDDTVANLESLTIAGYDLDFKPDKYEYNLTIENDVNFLDITPKTANLDAKYEIEGNMNLENGTIIKIKVSYNDEVNKTYRINIIKEEKKEEKSHLLLIIIISIVILLLIGAVVFFVIRNKKKKDPKTKDKKDKKEKDKVTVNVEENPNMEKIGANLNVPVESVGVEADTPSSSDVISIASDDIDDII